MVHVNEARAQPPRMMVLVRWADAACMRAVGDFLARLGIKASWAVASPHPGARQAASILASVLRARGVQVDPALAEPGGNPQAGASRVLRALEVHGGVGLAVAHRNVVELAAAQLARARVR